MPHAGSSIQSDSGMRQVVAAPIARYLGELHSTVDPLLDHIRAEGVAAGLPLVDVETARLLRSLVIATGARKVLEIGTAIGYSAVWMAQALPPDGLLISMELDAARAATARVNLERAGLAQKVSVIVGDAMRFLHKVAGPFDLIFQDGDKALYTPMLDALVEHLRPGGVLVTDNVLWDGEVVEGFVPMPRHDAVSTAAIRTYNARLAAEERLLTTFLPMGDGVALSVRTVE
jgi:predicted O-methyltransferase YrrM